MPYKILALTQDTGQSEDYNLNYTHYLKVSSETLDFSEPVFSEDGMLTEEKLIEHLQALGYAVEEQDVQILELNPCDDEEDEEDEE